MTVLLWVLLIAGVAYLWFHAVRTAFMTDRRQNLTRWLERKFKGENDGS